MEKPEKKQKALKNMNKKTRAETNNKEKIDKVINLYGHKRTFGQRAADNLAKWAGSWTFILFFFIFLVLWMCANIYMWVNEWDPYPFILLNLILSCLAAVQAPVILMRAT